MSTKKAKKRVTLEVGNAIEAQRMRVFQAMNFVDVTRMSLEEEDVARDGMLRAVHKILNDVALALNEISGQ